MAMVFIDIIMEMFILEIGRMMNQMAMVSIHLKINLFTRVILKMEYSVVKGN